MEELANYTTADGHDAKKTPTEPEISETSIAIRAIIRDIRDLMIAPWIFLRERMSPPGALDIEINALDRRKTAIHECGHGLIDLLGDYEIKIILISPFTSGLNYRLGIVAGFAGSYEQSELEIFVSTSDIVEHIEELLGIKDKKDKYDLDGCNEEYIVNDLLGYFAGFVAEYVYTEGRDVEVIVDTAPNDIKGFVAIITALRESGKYVIDEDLLITTSLQELCVFFRKPLIQEIMTIFGAELLARRVIKNDESSINREIEEFLTAKGILADELIQAKKEYEAMAARVIKKCLIPNPDCRS